MVRAGESIGKVRFDGDCLTWAMAGRGTEMCKCSALHQYHRRLAIVIAAGQRGHTVTHLVLYGELSVFSILRTSLGVEVERVRTLSEE